MKVLHVCAGNLYGGVETFLVTLAKLRHLAPDMEPEFALCFRGRLWDELTAAGVPVHDLGAMRLSRPWTVLRARWRLRRLLRKQAFPVVVCQMAWVLGLLGDIVRKAAGRLVVHIHGARQGGWVDRLAAVRRPDLVILPSEFTATTWTSTFTRSRKAVLYNPIPPQVLTTPELPPAERARIRQELGATTDEVVIFQASRLEPVKGVDRLLRALGVLRDVPGWRFWLAGGVQRANEQPYAAELWRLATDLGIANRVAFLGERSDVSVLLRAADLYCQGNRGPEGFSLSFLEASYCGLPVITTDLGGAPEMVDPQTGVLVAPGDDVTPLAEAIRSLLGEVEVRKEMGRRAHEKAIRLCDTGQQLRKLAGWLSDLTCGVRSTDVVQ